MFVAFPWGLETCYDDKTSVGIQKFVAFPWGLETLFSESVKRYAAPAFVAFPWGLETRSPETLNSSMLSVCSIPLGT